MKYTDSAGADLSDCHHHGQISNDKYGYVRTFYVLTTIRMSGFLLCVCGGGGGVTGGVTQLPTSSLLKVHPTCSTHEQLQQTDLCTVFGNCFK